MKVLRHNGTKIQIPCISYTIVVKSYQGPSILYTNFNFSAKVNLFKLFKH